MTVWFGLFANGMLFDGAWRLAGLLPGQRRTLDRLLAACVLSVAWCCWGWRGWERPGA